MSANPEPRSRRDRPAKPALTRSGIVAAALAVLREDGLERVTLRRLAQELDTGAASLYVYFRNGAALHAAILDELLGEVVLPPRNDPGAWADRVNAALWSYSGVLFEYPSMARSALVSRPTGPNYLALVEYLLTALQDGGIPGPQGARGVDLLLLYATAQSAEHSQRSRSADSAREDQELADAIRSAPPERYPAIAAVTEELLSGEPRARYDWDVRALLAGIATTPVGASRWTRPCRTTSWARCHCAGSTCTSSGSTPGTSATPASSGSRSTA